MSTVSLLRHGEGARGEPYSRVPTLAGIRVYVVVEVRLYAQALAELLEKALGLRVIGCADSIDHVAARAARLQPDVILVATQMPQKLAAARHLVESLPATKVVALGTREPDEEVFAWAEAGAAAYLARDADVTELGRALESITRGEVPCSARVGAVLFRRVAELAAGTGWDGGGDSHLTERELEIAGLLAQGLSNKEIALRLYIALATVKNHVHNILQKLDVERRKDVGPRLRARYGAEI